MMCVCDEEHDITCSSLSYIMTYAPVFVLIPCIVCNGDIGGVIIFCFISISVVVVGCIICSVVMIEFGDFISSFVLDGSI